MKQRLKKFVKGRAAKKLAIVSGSLLLGFIVLNLVLYGVFLHRTYPNTRVANFSIGTVDYGVLTKKIGSLSILPATIALEQHGQSKLVTPAQFGIQIDATKMAVTARSRDWLPVQNLIASHAVPASIKVSQATLTKQLAELASVDQRAPVNARIDIQNNQFTLVGSISGYQLDTKRASPLLTQAAEQHKTSVDLPFDWAAAAVTNASLAPSLQELQAQQTVPLSYSYNGKITKVPAATITSWYSLSGNTYALQASKIQAYISQVGANDNIHVQNLSAAVTATQTALQQKSALNFSLIAVPPSVCSTNTKSQLIVVSISQQHLWACQTYNQVYDTPVTTGAYQVAGDATPTGTWHIYAKETDTHLIGPTWDDFVNYWLPFYSDYGFHDATWQTFPFGSPEYPTQGSHGCVHLPLNAMAWLYNWTSIGTTVTVTN